MMLLLSLLYGLHTDRKQKLAVAAIFSLSLIIIIVAVIRAIEIRASTDHVDPVWLALWSMIEGSVAVIVACLPSFRILLSTRERSSSSYKRRNPSSSGHSDAQVRSANS
ncbi:hypothetical protein ABVK25_004169 [Lepraria finkii]|uniref:Rhodopsin domain-containing protein n=1 Tax=Lepraria finkii TaxID=1340010 RepID=A0ABR4BBY7_9LECA